MRADQLLTAAGGDHEEALRLLFVLAKRCAADPEGADFSGRELADTMRALLEGEPAGDGSWHSARRMVTAPSATDVGVATAATVAEAIDQVLHGKALELAPSEGRYDEEDLLGVGGMGQVHRVFDQRLQRTVALKALHHGVLGVASARRFAQEAELTAQLDHPNIVPLYDFDRGPDGGLYFTMKEVQGRSLSEVIDDARHEVEHGAAMAPLQLRMVGMFRQLCDGVAFAHDHGIAHRDLKPDNVMIGDFGEVQVMDWGLAERFGSAPSMAGTPAYMAPEVARSEGSTVGASQDIYALGATLHHILTFHPPYVGSRAQVLEGVRQGSPRPPSDAAAHPVPQELQAVALKAMAAAPEDRYRDVGSLIDDVQAWLDGRPLASLSYGPGALLTKWMRRNRRLVLGVGAAAVAATVLAAFGLVRYVLDITEARDDAQLQQGLAVQERDRASAAETTARRRLGEAQLATARAMTETERYGRAQALYEAAATQLQRLNEPPIGPQIGKLDNHARAARPMFTLAPLAPSEERVFDETNGWVLTLAEGSTLVAREPPLFDVAWRASVAVPECLARSVRWEGGTYALYCVTEGEVRRLDLGTGQSSRVTDLPASRQPSVDAPAFTGLLFVGSRDEEHTGGRRSWRVLEQEGGGWRTRFDVDVRSFQSALGDWFIGERYREPGAVLFHADRGRVRTLGLPMAHAFLSPDARHVAAYDEGSHSLEMETLEGEVRWQIEPQRPWAVRGFTSNGSSMFVSAETKLLQLSAHDGSRLQTFDGHDEAVQELLVTETLLLSRALDGTVVGYSRTEPSGRVRRVVSSLLPPGDVLVAHGGPRELVFLDVATRRILRRVALPMLAGGETWRADSAQRDGVLVRTQERLVFVPLAAAPVELAVRSEGAALGAASRLRDGRIAFCRGSDVVLRDLSGTETVLGRIAGPSCRHVDATGPGGVFVSDFQGRSVHRFGLGTAGPQWSASVAEPYRLSVESGRVSVGDWTGRVSVFDAETGAVVMTENITDGPTMGTAMSADASSVAVAGWDTRLCVVEVPTGRVLAEDARHSRPLEWVSWSADQRRLVTADPVEAVVRDLNRPAHLETAHGVLSELAASPDRERSRSEWAAVARGLAVHGLWADAVVAMERSHGLGALERARLLWLAGQPGRAAEQFARARSEALAGNTYLELCESAAREEAALE